MKVVRLTCKLCKNVFHPKPLGRPPKFCSAECGYAYRAKKDKKGKAEHTCLECGCRFFHRAEVKYCSDRCAKEFNEKKRISKEINNYKPTIFNCLFCSKRVVAGRGDNRRKFCSAKCMKCHEKKRDCEKKHELDTYICSRCGKKFGYRYKMSKSLCSDECKKKQREEKKERVRLSILLNRELVCPVCGDEFIGNHQAIYCSKNCSKQAENIRKWNRNHKFDIYTCRQCGKEFNPERGDKHRQFCSDECREELYKTDWIPEPVECLKCGTVYLPCMPHQKYCSRRCSKLANKRTTGEVNEFVYEYQGGRCRICGRKTRRDFHYNHPLYPNVDHIIPLGKGGSDELENMQLLCRECNLKKRDTLPKLMPLLGGCYV